MASPCRVYVPFSNTCHRRRPTRRPCAWCSRQGVMNRNSQHLRVEPNMRARILPFALSAVTVVLAACDTSVLNPGPVEDQFLTQVASQTALVNGAGRAVASGINWIGYTGAAVAREIHPAGSTGSFGNNPLWQIGELASSDGDLDTHWEQSQRARWVAERTILLMDSVGALSNNLKQQALVWAGFANRVLGENMCEAVIDGGPAQPNTEFFRRAEEHFTKAI